MRLLLHTLTTVTIIVGDHGESQGIYIPLLQVFLCQKERLSVAAGDFRCLDWEMLSRYPTPSPKAPCYVSKSLLGRSKRRNKDELCSDQLYTSESAVLQTLDLKFTYKARR